MRDLSGQRGLLRSGVGGGDGSIGWDLLYSGIEEGKHELLIEGPLITDLPLVLLYFPPLSKASVFTDFLRPTVSWWGEKRFIPPRPSCLCENGRRAVGPTFARKKSHSPS